MYMYDVHNAIAKFTANLERYLSLVVGAAPDRCCVKYIVSIFALLNILFAFYCSLRTEATGENRRGRTCELRRSARLSGNSRSFVTRSSGLGLPALLTCFLLSERGAFRSHARKLSEGAASLFSSQ